VQRNLKYVKYLQDFDWKPTVLTIKSKFFLLKDRKLLSDVPDNVKIFRTNCLKPKQDFFSWIKIDINKTSQDKSVKEKFLSRALRFAEKEMLIPDVWVGWIPFAVFTGNKIIDNSKIDVIFCSGGSFTSFVAGYVLSKMRKIPLVLDYRDGWIFSTDILFAKHNFFKSFVSVSLEKIILRHASQIVFVSKSLLNVYRSRFSFISEKSGVITNGFDVEDFPKIKPSSKKEKEFVMFYIGSCDINRKPVLILFLDIIKNILTCDKNLKSKLKILLVGALSKDIKKQIKKNNLDNVVKAKNFVPHKKAMEFMANSDALLLFIDRSPYNKVIFSGKLFEYLGAGKPILVFGPSDGEAGSLVKEVNAGVVVDYEIEAKNAMFTKTMRFIHKALNNKFKPNRKTILEKYERKKITKQLSDVLNKAIF